jgi:hypothetical protein
MSRCRNCGVEMGPEETCVFATYRTNVGGREIVVCCSNCASDLEQAATQSAEPKPVENAPSKKAPARKAPTRKAPRKVKRGYKAKKAAGRNKKAPKKVKRAARKVAQKTHR